MKIDQYDYTSSLAIGKSELKKMQVEKDESENDDTRSIKWYMVGQVS